LAGDHELWRRLEQLNKKGSEEAMMVFHKLQKLGTRQSSVPPSTLVRRTTTCCGFLGAGRYCSVMLCRDRASGEMLAMKKWRVAGDVLQSCRTDSV
jgi:hypothetical protein